MLEISDIFGALKTSKRVDRCVTFETFGISDILRTF